MNNSLWHLLLFKTLANLRTEVSRYYLNYAWWVIEPVLMMSVFYVVFGLFLNRGTQHYIAFLLVGLTCWNWFGRSVQNGASSIYQGRILMLQVDIPKVFFPLEVFLRDSFKQMFVLLLLLTFLLFYPTPVGLTWLALPALILTQAVFLVGFICLVAAIVPFIPDLKFVIGTAVQLMFFGSGVFYRIEDVVLPEHRYILYLNPVAGLIKNYREVLLYNHWPDWAYLGKVLVVSLFLCAFSFFIIKRFERVYPKVCNQ